MEEELETTNINIKWLENIYEQLKAIQGMERISNEGCNDLMEYFNIPFEMRGIIISDSMYKNLRFFAIELNMLIGNLTPILKGKEDGYRKMLEPILKNIDKRYLFLEERKNHSQLIQLIQLPMLSKTIGLLSHIKQEIIKEIGDILYIKQDDINKKKW